MTECLRIASESGEKGFKVIKIGLTGGIASGKSLVSSCFKRLGAYIIDADTIARQVVRPGSKPWKQIVKHFGKEILQEDGSLNRAMLGEIIFRDHSRRDILNNIIHPQVYEKINRDIKRFEDSIEKDQVNKKGLDKGKRVVVVDIPLLIETGNIDEFDAIVVVYCDPDRQIERLRKRDNLSEEKARERLRSQMPLKDKLSYTDYTVDNNGTKTETEREVKRIWSELLKKLTDL